LNGLILADGLISPKETEKWNLFANIFQGITYKSVPLENLKDIFTTKQTKSSAILELMSVALSKESLELEDKKYIKKIAIAMGIDAAIQKKMWSWVDRMLAITRESLEFME
jgi:hypothetical protein